MAEKDLLAEMITSVRVKNPGCYGKLEMIGCSGLYAALSQRYSLCSAENREISSDGSAGAIRATFVVFDC